MPIRFPCPACRQPLEVDDNWGGQNVACPYCRRVVTAPAASTWPSGNIPMASPAQQPAAGFAPPPPPAGFSPTPNAPRTSSALSGFVLTLAGAVLAIVAGLYWSAAFGAEITSRLGENPPMDKVQALYQEMASKGQLPMPPGVSYLVLLTLASCIGGIIMGAKALARQENNRGLAIAACILGGIFLMCPVMWGFILLAVSVQK